MVAPSRMDGSKPPDWTGFPENEDDFPEQVELSDSDSDSAWPPANYYIDALREQLVVGPGSQDWNRSINQQIRIIRNEHQRDLRVRDAEYRDSALIRREQREQDIRIRRYNDMQSEIISINALSNPTEEDIGDLNDLYASSDNLQAQIREFIRLYGFT